MNHWNKIYTEKKHLSEWPWSEVISLTNKFCKKSLDKKKHKMLELGFGAGANIPFFLTKNIFRSNYVNPFIYVEQENYD